MIKCNVTVIGTVTRSADIKDGRDGNPFITFGMRVHLEDGEESADLDISVAVDGKDEDLLFTNKGDRVKVEGAMTVKRIGDTNYFNLSATKVTAGTDADDSVSGTLQFRGTVGSKGLVEHQGNKGAFRTFDAFSAEKIGEDQFSYIWVHFVDFGDDKRVWIMPKTKISAEGALELQAYRDRVSLNCRIESLSKWTKDESKH
ncbi:MAG: single-stranded DNA-binding protein [Bacteroidales bacterium]|nr:single-stranded DNA-binding protein [Bacteroidales bacterium]